MLNSIKSLILTALAFTAFHPDCLLAQYIEPTITHAYMKEVKSELPEKKFLIVGFARSGAKYDTSPLTIYTFDVSYGDRRLVEVAEIYGLHEEKGTPLVLYKDREVKTISTYMGLRSEKSISFVPNLKRSNEWYSKAMFSNDPDRLMKVFLKNAYPLTMLSDSDNPQRQAARMIRDYVLTTVPGDDPEERKLIDNEFKNRMINNLTIPSDLNVPTNSSIQPISSPYSIELRSALAAIQNLEGAVEELQGKASPEPLTPEASETSTIATKNPSTKTFRMLRDLVLTLDDSNKIFIQNVSPNYLSKLTAIKAEILAADLDAETPSPAKIKTLARKVSEMESWYYNEHLESSNRYMAHKSAFLNQQIERHFETKNSEADSLSEKILEALISQYIDGLNTYASFETISPNPNFLCATRSLNAKYNCLDGANQNSPERSDRSPDSVEPANQLEPK